MTTHYLKTWPEHYQAIDRGHKKAELRLNDRNFQVGDVLILQEYYPGGTETFYDPSDYHGAGERYHEPEYTGSEITAHVTHILEGGEFGLEKGYVMMSIEAEI